MKNYSVDLNASFGGSIKILDGFFTLGAYFSKQYLDESTISLPAFGYLNNYNNSIDTKCLLDFNREKDAPYYENIALMPVTNRTYDLYSVQGQGIGGSFRAYENQPGIVFDNENENTGWSGNASIELGGGDISKIGFDLTGIFSNTNTKVWNKNALYANDKNIRALRVKELRAYEPVVFKFNGETNAESDIDYINATGGINEPIRLDVRRSGENNYLLDNYLFSTTSSNASAKSRNSRVKRTQFINSFNAIDASKYGIDKEIKIYDASFNLCEGGTYQNESSEYKYTSRERNIYPSHHISELSVTQTNGAQYIYGIPAYVNKQVEATFSVNEDDYDEQAATGTIVYQNGDDSKENDKGKDNLCQITTLPAYAHSYLLTSILSPEYIDLTGNGPTDDDLGNYTKFNYRNISYEKNVSYKWRTPSEPGNNVASYNPGHRYNINDGKGSYVYGEKEIWYMHSIETKNYIVEFELADRHDGYGVKGKEGGFNFTDPTTKQTKCLKEIRLYSKKEKLSKNTQAVPIKTIHFEYDYSLCGNVPNNDGESETVNSVNINANKGKLTLKRIYFTYGKSNKGKLNAYEFDYSNLEYVNDYNSTHTPQETNIYNPDYNIRGIDRWGFYTPAKSNPLGLPNASTIYNSFEFPYVDQRDFTSNAKPAIALAEHQCFADIYSSAWSLTSIKLPSGSKINIKYESDDYAYIQDKRASQMVSVLGFGNSPSSGSSDIKKFTFDDPAIIGSTNHYKYIYLELPKAVSSNKEFKDLYLGSMSELFFKVRLELSWGYYEDISGYAKIKGSTEGTDYGVLGNGTTAYIHIDDFTMEGKNPVAVAAWRFCMENESNFISGKQPLSETPSATLAFIQAINPGAIIQDLIDVFRSPWSQAEGRDIGRIITPEYSWARLYNPTYFKKGGGSRVKKIEILDSFDGQDKTYGQEYEYKTTEKINGQNQIISSGVAAYEPQAGGDENTFHRPIFYKTSGGFLQPDNYTYLEEPAGENFFPAASVGYSKVKVTPITNSDISRHKTGITVQEFYTAKDFPTICNRTSLKEVLASTNWLAQIISSRSFKKAGVAQGYIVKTNDMHGKPKAVYNYSGYDDKIPISGEEYFYYCGGKVLNNNIPVLTKDAPSNDNNTKLLATDYDVTNDLRYSNTEVVNAGVEVNLSFFIAGIFPFILPPVWPKHTKNETEFKSAITTKHVHQYGILKEVIKFDQSSRVKTTNLKFDPETGEVLLTKTENLHNDNTYNLTLPSHWVNSGMAASYLNTGVIVNNAVNSWITWNNEDNGNPLNGSFEFNNTSFKPSDYFTKGDVLEIKATKSNSTCKTYSGWVLDVINPGQGVTNGKISVVDFSGSRLLNGTYTINSIRVIKSGHKNNQSLPVMSATTKENPVPYLSTNALASAKVLNSEAIEYDNTRKIYFNKNTRCERVLSDEMKDALYLLNYLVSRGKYINNQYYSGSNVPSCNKPVYLNSYPSSVYSEALRDAYYNSTNKYFWKGRFLKETSSTHFNYGFTFGINSTYTTGCNSSQFNLFTLNATDLPYDFDYNDVLRFENLQFYINGNYECENACMPCPNFKVNCITKTKNGGVQKISFTGTTSVLTNCPQTVNETVTGSWSTPIINAWMPQTVYYNSCEIDYGIPVNPYTLGILANWYPRTAYKYLGLRSKTNNGTSVTDTRNDGYYSTYSPFWKYNSTQSKWEKETTQSILDKWQFTNSVTIKDQYGNEVENTNPLNINSAALYGFNSNLPIAVATNTKHKELIFEGFEEQNVVSPCPSVNIGEAASTPECMLPFRITDGAGIVNTVSHTGLYSCKLNSTDNHFSPFINNSPDAPMMSSKEVVNDENNTLTSTLPLSAVSTQVKAKFSPDQGKSYLISFWMYNTLGVIETLTSNTLVQFQNNITCTGCNNVITFEKISVDPPINGWQRVVYKMNIPNTYSTLPNAAATQMILHNNASGGNNVYIDDLRIQPYQSIMKTYVYDDATRRLAAELDENNFATFYEYDEEGALARVKKETSKGIFTVKEIRKNISK